MKHTINTAAGKICIEPSDTLGGFIKITVKAGVWPEFTMPMKPSEAALIVRALELSMQYVANRVEVQ